MVALVQPRGGPGRVRDSATTGPDGFYSFDFNFGDGTFKVIGEAKGYYKPYHTQVENLKAGEDHSYNLELWPHAWLKVNFVNQSGADGVNVNHFYGEVFGYQIYRVPDATVIGRVKGNSENDVNYFPQPEGRHHQATIYCLGLDTTFLQIIY